MRENRHLALREESLGPHSFVRSARHPAAPCGALPTPSLVTLQPVASIPHRFPGAVIAKVFWQLLRTALARSVIPSAPPAPSPLACPAKPGPEALYPLRFLPEKMQSRYSYPRQSPVSLQLPRRTRKTNFCSQLPQPSVRPRCRHQLQASTHRLRNAFPARFLRGLQKLRRNFHRNLSRRSHNASRLPCFIPA